MGFIDDMRIHTLSLLQTLDGRVFTYTPVSGAPRNLSGLLQEFSDLTGGETVEVVVTKPVLSIRTVDIPEIQSGDMFSVEGNNYEGQVIRPDNEGITELILEKL